MKTKLLLIIILTLLFISFNSNAQTVLSPGDIAVFQAQGDNPDSFAFVTFVDIAAGTGIYFTDCGADATGFRSPNCTEGARKYTAPAGGLTAGRIVTFTGSETDFVTYSDAGITGNFLFSTGGDQVIAFQDATDATGGTNASANPTFLFIISYASTVFAGDKNDSNETGLPTGLSDTSSPATALALGAGPGADNEWDNVIYNGSYDFSSEADMAASIAAAKLAFSDLSNYYQTNTLDGTYTTAASNIPISLTLSPTLSNEVDASVAEFSIYPNPAISGEVTISSASNSEISVVAYDVLGKQVKNTALTNNRLDVSDLKTGMYILRITQDNATTTKKLMIR